MRLNNQRRNPAKRHRRAKSRALSKTTDPPATKPKDSPDKAAGLHTSQSLPNLTRGSSAKATPQCAQPVHTLRPLPRPPLRRARAHRLRPAAAIGQRTIHTQRVTSWRAVHSATAHVWRALHVHSAAAHVCQSTACAEGHPAPLRTLPPCTLPLSASAPVPHAQRGTPRLCALCLRALCGCLAAHRMRRGAPRAARLQHRRRAAERYHRRAAAAAPLWSCRAVSQLRGRRGTAAELLGCGAAAELQRRSRAAEALRSSAAARSC